MSAALWSRTNAGSFRVAMLAMAGVGLLVAALPVLVIVIMSFSGDAGLEFPPRSRSRCGGASSRAWCCCR